MATTDRISDRILNSFHTATITFNYLNSKGSSHRHPFHALAELTDNSKDAHAKRVEIDFVERNKQDFIEILDDGDGMTQEEVAKIVAFGHTKKRSTDEEMIGRYGNGLKAGGLRLGKEILLLTKKNNMYTAMMLSHKFQEAMNRFEKVFVPCPCFDEDLRPKTTDSELHEAEVHAINTWGPLGGETLPSLFAKLVGASGTLIIIGSLRRDVLGSLEMKVSATGEDVNTEGDEQEEWETSLRKYLGILYKDSVMQIRLRGREVEQKQETEWFLLKKVHTIRDITFSGNWQKKNEELKKELNFLLESFTECRSAIGTMNNMEMGIDQESRRKRNEAAKKYEETTVELEEKKKEKEEHEKQKRKTVSIDFNCALKCKDRHNYGIFIYLNNRLIIAGYKSLAFFKNPENIGICMVICLTNDIVSPTADKQGIETASDFSKILKSCSLVLNYYKEYLGREGIRNLLPETFSINIKDAHSDRLVFEQFWRAFGYSYPYTIKCQQKELMKNIEEGIDKVCGFWRKCQNCLFWRQIMATRPPPERFQCAPRCKPGPDAPRYDPLVVQRPPTPVRPPPTPVRRSPFPVRLPVRPQVMMVKPESPPAYPSRLQSTVKEERRDDPRRTELVKAERATVTFSTEEERKRKEIPTLIADISDEDVTKRRRLNKNEEQPTCSTSSSEPSTSAANGTCDPYEDIASSDEEDEESLPESVREVREARDKLLKENVRKFLKHVHENPDFRFTVAGGSSNIYERMSQISEQIDKSINETNK